MSIADLWHDMYQDACKRANTASDQAFQTTLRLTKYQAAHLSLLAHLRMAANDLAKTQPIMSDRYHEVANNWEKWCEEPQQSLGEAARMEGPVSGHSGSEASPQTEAPVGTEESYCDLSPEVRQQLWDSTAPQTSLVKP